MDVILEILAALASIANIVILLLELYDRLKEYRHRQMTRKKVKLGKHRASYKNLTAPPA